MTKVALEVNFDLLEFIMSSKFVSFLLLVLSFFLYNILLLLAGVSKKLSKETVSSESSLDKAADSANN